VRVVTDLVAGVAPVSSEAALAEMTGAGAVLIDRAGLDAERDVDVDADAGSTVDPGADA